MRSEYSPLKRSPNTLYALIKYLMSLILTYNTRRSLGSFWCRFQVTLPWHNVLQLWNSASRTPSITSSRSSLFVLGLFQIPFITGKHWWKWQKRGWWWGWGWRGRRRRRGRWSCCVWWSGCWRGRWCWCWYSINLWCRHHRSISKNLNLNVTVYFVEFWGFYKLLSLIGGWPHRTEGGIWPQWLHSLCQTLSFSHSQRSIFHSRWLVPWWFDCYWCRVFLKQDVRRQTNTLMNE